MRVPVNFFLLSRYNAEYVFSVFIIYEIEALFESIAFVMFYFTSGFKKKKKNLSSIYQDKLLLKLGRV